jgi:3-oxoacyl-[acyl-carrier protein] reductase
MSMPFNELLAGQTALVTGGARGIGKACAMQLSAAGAAVAIIDRLADEGRGAAQAIVEAGGKAVAFSADVSETGRIPTLVKRVEETFGPIGILVNNAGISSDTATADITEAQWDRMMSVNLKSAFFMTQAVLPLMVRRKGGAIVNVGSVVARSGGVNSTVDYTVSKAGVLGMTRTLARQYGPSGIRVNAVAPGPIATEMMHDWSEERLKDMLPRIPLGRIGTVDDVAMVVLFLASPWAAYLTGVTIDVAGGLYMA